MPPERLEELVAAYQRAGCPVQPPVGWRRQPWRLRMPEHAAILDALPSLLDRAEVRARAEAPQDPEGALRGFLAVMVWGFGHTGYGPWRVQSAVDATPDLPEVLLESARRAATDPVAGYRLLAERRPRRIGPAFATKYLHFAVPISAAAPLILDRVVAGWLSTHARVRLDPGRWSPPTYERYLACVDGWAADLKVLPALLEELIFRDAAGGQWAAPQVLGR